MLPVSFERILDYAISPFLEDFSSCVIVGAIVEFGSSRGVHVEITALDRAEAWVLIGWIQH